MDNKRPFIDPKNGIFAPPSIQERGENWQRRNDLYWRTFVIDEFPKSIDFGWYSRVLDHLPFLGGNIEIHPLDSDDDYVSEPTKYTSNLYSRKYRQEYDHDRREFRTKRAIEGTQRSIADETQETRYFKVAIFFVAKSKAKLGLEILTTRLYKVALQMGFSVRPIKGRHDDAISAASPTGFEDVEYYTVFTGDTVAHLTAPIYFG